MRGDVDCNGKVDSADALKILKVVSGKGQFKKCASSADMDCDGALTAGDAMRILRYVVRFPAKAVDSCPAVGSADSSAGVGQAPALRYR